MGLKVTNRIKTCLAHLFMRVDLELFSMKYYIIDLELFSMKYYIIVYYLPWLRKYSSKRGVCPLLMYINLVVLSMERRGTSHLKAIWKLGPLWLTRPISTIRADCNSSKTPTVTCLSLATIISIMETTSPTTWASLTLYSPIHIRMQVVSTSSCLPSTSNWWEPSNTRGSICRKLRIWR